MATQLYAAQDNMWSIVRKMGQRQPQKLRRYLFSKRTPMLERYHDAIIRAVNILGEKLDPKLQALFRTSPGGVAGMSRTCSVAVVSSNLGLLILLVVHVCASTMANRQNQYQAPDFLSLKCSGTVRGERKQMRGVELRSRIEEEEDERGK